MRGPPRARSAASTHGPRTAPQLRGAGIGIGAEYAHNMMQRYRFEGPGKLRQVVLATGGALTLCSLTTSVGYFALLFSINKGIHSFGLSAAVGELVCLAATVLWLPALLAYLESRRQKKSLAGPARA